MTWPHSQDFRGGMQIVFWSATIAGLLAMFVPGEPTWHRFLALALTYFGVGPSFGAGWLIAHFWRLALGWISPSLALGLCLFYFYVFLVGAIAMLLLMPFEHVALSGQETREMIMFVPAAIASAGGVRYVVNKHAVAV
jgi:MFS family permease